MEDTVAPVQPAGPTALDSAPLWEALQRRRISALRCDSCDTLLHPPRPRCPNCGSYERTVAEIDGGGEVYASTIVELETDPRWPVPYTVVLVDVTAAPGLRLVGHLPGRWPLRAGDPVTPAFWRAADGVVGVSWFPTETSGQEVEKRLAASSKHLLD